MFHRRLALISYANRIALWRLACGALAILLAIASEIPAGAAEPPLDPDHAAKFARGQKIFREHVRDVLVGQCLRCHGGEEVESEFDLSSREKLLRGGAVGPAVVLGDADRSLLIRLVRHAEDPHMPLEADKLPDADLAALAEWINLGAPYDGELAGAAPAEKTPWYETRAPEEAKSFWSFRPLAPSPLPSVTDAAWCRTDVDRFVLARLEAAGLKPNGPAEKSRLVRRTFLDLTGLPPRPEELSEALTDSADGWLARLVDRLLASPRYGERWARHWLDVARFAESHGYEHDYDRPTAFHYRDFVIRALNRDLPYNTFVAWQLAGDELAPDDPLAAMATGFLAAGVHSTQITKNEVEKHRYDELDDMLNTVGTAMLGLSIGCARCHDHKYDPIPQGDYYRMLATFTTTVRSEQEVILAPQEYAREKAAFDEAHAPLLAARTAYEAAQLPERLVAWEAGEAKSTALAAPWVVPDVVEITAKEGARFLRQADGSLLAVGANPQFDVYTLVVHTRTPGVRQVRIEALADPSLPQQGPGRADNGNFSLTDVKLKAAPLDNADNAVDVSLANPRASFEQAGLPIRAAIDKNEKSGWAIDGHIGESHAAAFDLAAPLAHAAGSKLTLTLAFSGNDRHAIGRLRISLSTAEAPAELSAEALPEAARAALGVAAAERTANQTAALLAWFRTTDPGWNELHRPVAEHERRAPLPRLAKALISSEGVPAVRLHTQGDDFLPQTHFLRRGETANKDAVAEPGVLQALCASTQSVDRWRETPPPGSRTSYRRRNLAAWLTDVEQGAGALLARVIVNRLWQHHFGQGIVTTSSDFGARGAAPTHPELLDWLAAELIRNNWRLKPIHRLLMTSAAYQQSSAYVAAAAAVDPGNQWLWRYPRRRMEGEVVRDSLLAVAGTLDTTMFGPGTLDSASRRRSVYFTVKRSQLMPMMQVFDGPDALQGVGQRPTTTIAPQALTLLNNPYIRETMKAFARRCRQTAADNPTDVAARAYRLALAREPAAEEAADAATFIAAQAQGYAAAGQAEPELLATADFCQVIVCLNEFVYLE